MPRFRRDVPFVGRRAKDEGLRALVGTEIIIDLLSTNRVRGWGDRRLQDNVFQVRVLER